LHEHTLIYGKKKTSKSVEEKGLQHLYTATDSAIVMANLEYCRLFGQGGSDTTEDFKAIGLIIKKKLMEKEPIEDNRFGLLEREFWSGRTIKNEILCRQCRDSLTLPEYNILSSKIISWVSVS
jgi:hypothetical protein